MENRILWDMFVSKYNELADIIEKAKIDENMLEETIEAAIEAYKGNSWIE